MKSALEYHDGVSYDRYAMKGGYLNWNNRPSVYKEYKNLPLISLPGDFSIPEVSTFRLLSGMRKKVEVPEPGIENIAQVFALAYGFTAKARHGSENFYYRSAPSAGALFPVEIYLASQGTNHVGNGLYHYTISRFGLIKLRDGCFDEFIRTEILDKQESGNSLTFFLTILFYRSAWKYRDRAYRYHLLDSGHVLENLSLALVSAGFPSRIELTFEDKKASVFLGLNSNQEAPIALVRCVRKTCKDRDEGSDVPVIQYPIKPVAPKEEFFSEINEIDTMCRLTKPFSGGRESENVSPVKRVTEWTSLETTCNGEMGLSYYQTVMTRRSKRNFVRQPMDVKRFSALVSSLAIAVNDNPIVKRSTFFYTGALIGAVEEFESGFYAIDLEEVKLGKIRAGSFCARMAQACLDQGWLVNASVHFVFIVDFNAVERSFGPRGYRYAMIESGRLGQRLYLAATAIGLGCCGIGAFYDGEAAEILGLSGQERMVYLVGVGMVKK